MKSAFAALLIVVAPTSAQRAMVIEGWPYRHYDCMKLAAPPAIDGDPSDWVDGEAVTWTEAFIDIEGDKRPLPRFATRAAMAWDDGHFYFAAEMEEPHLWGTLARHDNILHHQNNFEIFIDPDGDGAMYHEVQINILNTIFDLLLVKAYRDGGPARHDWHVEGLQSAVRLDGTPNDPSDTDQGWSMELAIPWAALEPTAGAPCPPAAGDTWRVNFSRVQWHLEPVESGYTKVVNADTGRPLAEDNWVWSPQKRINMHAPEYWGFVRFVASPGEAAPGGDPVQLASPESQ